MLKVRIRPYGYEIRVSGHADYAPRGSDIVCSAASILTHTLAAMLSGEDGYEYTDSGGEVRIACTPVKARTDYASVVMAFAANGFEALAQSYPDNVEVNYG